ncbi:MAG: hypothetical protein OEM51_01695 [Gammaproteobacteria bacterium]|nr:hypothetical protein [Gammaproteobacteria bacterium]
MARKTRRNRNWSHELAMFEAAPHKTRTYKLTSPGVAQVTRVRLVQNYDTHVAFRTEGNALIFEK